MPIETECPKCQRALRVPDDLLGKQVKCPACEEVFAATKIEPLAEPSLPPANSTDGVRELLPAPPRRVDQYDDDDDEDFSDEPRRRRHYKPHRGTLILVLGIISFPLMTSFGIGFATGIAAWIMGNNDLKLMREGIMDPTGESMTNAGRIIGMIVTILNVPVCLCGVAYIAGMLAMGK